MRHTRCSLHSILIALALSLPVLTSSAEDLAISSRASGSAVPAPPLPSVEVSAGTARGNQLLRFSMPCPPAALLEGQGVVAHVNGTDVPADVRILTLHPGQPRSARRAMITVPFENTTNDLQRVGFAASPANEKPPHVTLSPDQHTALIVWDAVNLEVSADKISAHFGDQRFELTVTGLAPATGAPRFEVVEDGRYYAWIRVHTAAPEGPRVLEVRADSLGTLAASVQIQRAEKGDGYTPAFGWRVTGLPFAAPAAGQPGEATTTDGAFTVHAPIELNVRGKFDVAPDGALTYWRCIPEERVPWQEAAWRHAEIVLGKAGHSPRNALLEPHVLISYSPGAFAPLLREGAALDLKPWPALEALRQFTYEGIRHSAAIGDDLGNVTSFSPGSEHGGAFGMNRLNHAPAMFDWDWHDGLQGLRDTGVAWCLNMYDLSIWWGEGDRHGGTRYNNAVAANQKEHEGDKNFMWRTNDASTFCTKGFDTFLDAYEETGDPRFAEALHAQLAYAKKYIHVNDGEARNIGDVRDFLDLYHATGEQEHLDEALRLFHELREKLSTGDLFSQGGQPLEADPPFIEDDAGGYNHPFAKPYIIGYALAGLPDLLRLAPDEPKLRDVVRAVADFLASTVDPSGGWRYPHPRSSSVIISQGMEHANQICNAAGVLEERGENIDGLLDAVETVLQARVMGYLHTGAILAGLSGWERNAGALPEGQKITDLYKKPEDRDPTRDYAEGAVGFGGSPPEGLVYFDNVLRFYLAHRPAERLFHANAHLQQLLDRTPKAPPKLSADPDFKAPDLPFGMKAGRPAFADAAIARMEFPMSFVKSGRDFPAWRTEARARYIASLQAAPPRAAFNVEVMATEDRGTYEAHKLKLNLSGDYRVTAYLLVPKHEAGARLPAVLALHDHGAHFSIGKEKVNKPFSVDDAVMQDAQQWVDASYGGRWFGDELAKRGYVVFSTDAIFWGERGRAEGVDYTAQETLASNLYQLGMSFAGTIVWDDIRAAEFVQSLPEVDPSRIAAMGLSMGAHRTWNLAAATDIIKAGAAICWLGDTRTLMAEGNNQTRGQSAHSMTFPGLRNEMDFADIASIACSKPMLFYNGTQDGLFPIDGVNAAYTTLHAVYASQNAEPQLETRLWDVPHEFNTAMQDAAFTWLDAQLRPKPPAP